MRAGDLVKTTRAQIGVPQGTIGLVIKSHQPRGDYLGQQAKEKIHTVQLLGTDTPGIHTRRFLGRDLKIVQ